MICDVYDNVLEPHIAELIDMEMKEITWQYDYKSHGKEVNKHWHTLCGHDKIEPEYSFLASIWETAKIKYNFDSHFFLHYKVHPNVFYPGRLQHQEIQQHFFVLLK